MFSTISRSAFATSSARARFYDAALKPLGLHRISEGETSLGYGRDSVALSGSTWCRKPVPEDEWSGLHFCCCADAPPQRR